MKTITWPQAAVILAFLACVTALGLTHNETGALIAVGVAILGGLGIQLGQSNAIRENTNGNQARLLEIVARSSVESAAAAKRGLEILEGNQRALVSLAHTMGNMTPAAIEAAPAPTHVPDQAKRAA